MSNAPTKCSESEARRTFVELLQQIAFGRLENLIVRKGDPVLDPPPRVIREVKFGGENGPRPECDLKDFALKAQVVDLFSEFDCVGDGVIDVLTVKHGLPFNMHVEAAATA